MPYATTSTTSRLSGRRRPCRPAGPMADTSFESLADSLLAALEEGIGDHADAELQGGIAVLILGLVSDDLTAVDLQDRDRNMYALVRKDAGHADLLCDDT